MQGSYELKGLYGEAVVEVTIYGVPKGIGTVSQEYDAIIMGAIGRLDSDLPWFAPKNGPLVGKTSVAGSAGLEEDSMVIEVQTQGVFGGHVDSQTARRALKQFSDKLSELLVGYVDQCKARTANPITAELQQVFALQPVSA